MTAYSVLPRNRFFEVLGGLNHEHASDSKVAMVSEIDMSSAERLRRKTLADCGVKPTYTALVAGAVALALRENPYANRIPITWPWRKRIVQMHQVDVSVAVELDEQTGAEQAAMVATIRDTDRKPLVEITRELQRIAKSDQETDARQGKFLWLIRKLPCFLAKSVLSIPRFFPRLWIEHRGGAALISSPAKYGVDLMVGTWAWPLAFSFGLVRERPLAVAGAVVVRPTMMLTMSFDRRLMAGAPAARFFNAVCERLGDAENALAKSDEATAPALEAASA